jgi:hypothetical protein
MSTPTLANARAREPETASLGTKACWPARWVPTVYSPAVLWAKAPTNTLRTTWVPRSRMKFRSSRGEYWPEAICRATMVRAKTSPVTVIMVVETTIRTLRASSALP